MSSNYKGGLLSNFIALTIIQGTNFLLPLVVMPFVIKKIGADGFGIVSVAQVVMIYISTISDYGFNLTATRDIARNKRDQIKISKIFFIVLTSKLLITFIAFLVLLTLGWLLPVFQHHFLLYLLGFVYVIGQSLLVNWFFQGMEKMQYITIITLLARFIFVLLVFLFIRHKADYIFFLFFLGVGNIFAGVISICLAWRIFKLKFFRPGWDDIIVELKEGWHITVSNLAISTSLYSNVFILRIFTNDLIVGYYSIAEKIFFAVRQILGIFSQAIYPRICELSIKSKEQLPSFFKKNFLPFFLFMLIVCVMVFEFSSPIIHIFLNTQTDLSIFLLQMLSFVPLIVCLNIPAYQLLLAFNGKKSYSSVLVIATIVNIISNLLLCNAWGAIGTVISIILTEIFITIGLNYQLYKNKLYHFISPP